MSNSFSGIFSIGCLIQFNRVKIPKITIESEFRANLHTLCTTSLMKFHSAVLRESVQTKKNQKRWTKRLNRQVKKHNWYIPCNLFCWVLLLYINILVADNIESRNINEGREISACMKKSRETI